jgi:hypothetical protein
MMSVSSQYRRSFIIPFPLDSVMNLGCARFATGRDAWRNRPGRVLDASEVNQCSVAQGKRVTQVSGFRLERETCRKIGAYILWNGVAPFGM